jgi:hypothetical protein
MRRLTVLVALVGAGLIAWWQAPALGADETQPRHDVVYTCNCGPECECRATSLKPGTCSCGMELAWGHVVRIEGSDALVCQCKEGCTCTIDAEDPSRCGCGQPLKRVSLKGTGIYFCNCGGSCGCNHLADGPGTCSCGMDLVKADV